MVDEGPPLELEAPMVSELLLLFPSSEFASSISHTVFCRMGVCPQPVLLRTLGSRSCRGSKGANSMLEDLSLRWDRPSLLSPLSSLAGAVPSCWPQELSCWSWPEPELPASMESQPLDASPPAEDFPQSPQPPLPLLPPPLPWRPQAERPPDVVESQLESLGESAALVSPLPHTELPVVSPLSWDDSVGDWPPQPVKPWIGLIGS